MKGSLNDVGGWFSVAPQKNFHWKREAPQLEDMCMLRIWVVIQYGLMPQIYAIDTIACGLFVYTYVRTCHTSNELQLKNVIFFICFFKYCPRHVMAKRMWNKLVLLWVFKVKFIFLIENRMSLYQIELNFRTYAASGEKINHFFQLSAYDLCHFQVD